MYFARPSALLFAMQFASLIVTFSFASFCLRPVCIKEHNLCCKLALFMLDLAGRMGLLLHSHGRRRHKGHKSRIICFTFMNLATSCFSGISTPLDGKKGGQSKGKEAQDGNRRSKMERDGISKSNRKGPTVCLIHFNFGSKL